MSKGSRKGSDLMVAALENEGVDRIFGVPGEENLDMVESLRNSSIQLVLTRHEHGAEQRIGRTGGEVERTRPEGRDADAGLAGEPAIGRSHECGALLMPGSPASASRPSGR